MGVLKIAKEKGLIPQLKPLLDQLIQEAGFRVSKALYQQILKQEGEV
ncbi:MAG: DUF3368 domain-containing protein [Saprospiraceae bacterium]|nr:DUF3368 domain-containing protein [Saprospiraceae bacterium]